MTASGAAGDNLVDQESAAPLPPEDYLIEGVNKEILRIELDKFSGPFEVLLYLIRAQEIDIFDIPIVKVTEQYLRFLDLLKDSNLDVAGDFLVMAATLIQIKSRMILPIEVDGDEEEEEFEEEDPRLDLVEKLLEYRKFKDLTDALDRRCDEVENWFGRRVKPKVEAAADDDEEDYLEVGLHDLIRAIRAIMRYVTDPAAHEIAMEGASVDEKISEIEEILRLEGTLTWRDLFKQSARKVEIVCCLLAILELCRMNRIRVMQHRNFGDMRIMSREGGDQPLETPGEDAQEDVEVAEANP